MIKRQSIISADALDHYKTIASTQWRSDKLQRILEEQC